MSQLTGIKKETALEAVETAPITRSARKRAAILEAATQAFLEKGYIGTSVDEIAAIASVSKRTVYQHFGDKQALFTEIILGTTSQVDEVVKLVAKTLETTRDLEKDLTALARAFLTTLMRPELLRLRRLVIADAYRFPDLGKTWYDQGFGHVLQTLAASFQQLSDDGKLSVDDPDLAASQFVGMLLWIPVNRAMFTGELRISRNEIQRFAQAASQTFLRAYSGTGPHTKLSPSD